MKGNKEKGGENREGGGLRGRMGRRRDRRAGKGYRDGTRRERTEMRGWEGIGTSHPLHQKILDPPLPLLNAKQ